MATFFSNLNRSYNSMLGGNENYEGPIRYDRPLSQLRQTQSGSNITSLSDLSPFDRAKKIAEREESNRLARQLAAGMEMQAGIDALGESKYYPDLAQQSFNLARSSGLIGPGQGELDYSRYLPNSQRLEVLAREGNAQLNRSNLATMGLKPTAIEDAYNRMLNRSLGYLR